MSLARTSIKAVLVAILSIVVATAGYNIFYLRGLRSLAAREQGQGLEISAETLDHEIRTVLPAGSSRNQVETVLRSRQLRYDYPSGDEIDAVARDLKKSRAADGTVLAFRFHFDNRDLLQTIDSSVVDAGS